MDVISCAGLLQVDKGRDDASSHPLPSEMVPEERVIDILEVYRQTREAQELHGVEALAPVLEKYVGCTHLKSGVLLTGLQTRQEFHAEPEIKETGFGWLNSSILYFIFVPLALVLVPLFALLCTVCCTIAGFVPMVFVASELMILVPRIPGGRFLGVSDPYEVMAIVLGLSVVVTSIMWLWLLWRAARPRKQSEATSSGKGYRCPVGNNLLPRLLGGHQKEAQVDQLYLLYCEDMSMHLCGSRSEIVHFIDINDMTISVHGDGSIVSKKKRE